MMKAPVIHALFIASIHLGCSPALADAEVGSWLEIYVLTTECRVQMLSHAEVESDGYTTVLGKYRIWSEGMSQSEIGREVEAALSDALRRRIKSVHVQLYKDREALELRDPVRPLVILNCRPPEEVPHLRDGYNRRLGYAVPPVGALQSTVGSQPLSRIAPSAVASSVTGLSR